MTSREQEYYDAAYAKAVAAADCASSVRMTIAAGCGIPEGVKNVQAYRDEVKRIGDDLTWDAEDANYEAEILYLTEDPKEE
jgi:hypothetical protein